MPVDYAGNTLEAARSLTLTPTTQTFTDYVDSLDPNDYYRFTLSGRSSFNLSMNGLSADADVQLLNSSGNSIVSSTYGGTTAESIITTLDAGTYYVRVYPYIGSTNYNLNLAATPVDYAGNTLGAARDIGTLSSSNTTYSDWLGSADTNDFYRFSITNSSDLSLLLNGLSADADLQLIRDINSNGLVDSNEVLQGSYATSTTAESINFNNLAAGTYYVRAYQYSGDTNYNLRLSAIPDPGNTLTTANNIGTLGFTAQTYSNSIGGTDTNDYYRFNLSETRNLNVVLNGLSADANLQVIRDTNSNGVIDAGEVLQSSVLTGTTADSITLNNLAAGSYFARVYPFSGTTNYNLTFAAAPLDNAGNTTAAARNIGTLTGSQTYRDFVGSLDTNDYYSFSLGTNSNFSLSLSGLAADADVQVLNSAGTVIGGSYSAASTSEAISLTNQAAGTYYVRVYQYSGDTYYNLGLSATPVDNAGNTLATARNIGALNYTTQTFSDWVGSLDTNDYYRFTTAYASNLSVVLNGLSADANLQLIRDANSNGVIDAGEVLQASSLTGTAADAINFSNLAAGTYFIRAYQASGNTNYNLALAATPLDYAGNTTDTARVIGKLSSPQVFNDFVGANDTNDYYRFSIGTASNVSLLLSDLVSGSTTTGAVAADADVRVLRRNADGTTTLVAGSYNSGSASENLNLTNLAAGIYYVQVYRYAGDTTYTLSLNSTPYTPPDNAGNTLGTARDIGTLSSTTAQAYTDFVGSIDTNDYYRFNLSANSNLSVLLNGLTADADLQLIRDTNSNGVVDAGEVLQSSLLDGTVAESITVNNLAAGSYFVRVYPYSGDTNYSLSFSAPFAAPPDNAGNTLSTARNIGTLSTAQTYTDWVGSADTNDYYSFNLAATSNLSVLLNGLSANADLQLIRDTNANGVIDAGEVLQSSAVAGTANDSITLNNLAAGTYFVRVYPNGGNTNYNLTLSATSSVINDWFSQNLRDTGLINTARSLAADNQLSRNDMIAIFRDAKDGGVVDATEVVDLRTIVNNSTRFNMADYVRYLSTQVANPLAVNMSDTALEALIGRQFLGTVAPTNSFNSTTFTYTVAQGTLYGSSGRANIDDIDQGGMGDCAFLASLGAVVNSRPDIVSSMIIDNGDNTYTIRFYSSTGGNSGTATTPGSAEYVTVDRRLATNSSGQLLFAAAGSGSATNSSNVIWAALVERAYAQWREFREGSNGYNLIGNGDLPQRPLTYITGRSANDLNTPTVTFSQIQSALTSNRPVTAWTYDDSTYIVGDHAYSITSTYVNSRGEQRVVVRNPWGVDGRTIDGANDGFVDLSFSQFLAAFPRINFVS